jgi:hypothetical protein
MRVRAAAIIALLVYEAMFLNILLPGHTRGSITLAPKDATPAAKAEAKSGGCCRIHNEPAQEQKPTEKDRASCALCFFAARLVTPPPALTAPVQLELVELLRAAEPTSRHAVDAFAAYDGRAPPALV